MSFFPFFRSWECFLATNDPGENSMIRDYNKPHNDAGNSLLTEMQPVNSSWEQAAAHCHFSSGGFLLGLKL